MAEAAIPFKKDMDFTYGVAAEISPLVRRMVAGNPSPFTFHGTNSYIVGHGAVAVIDPGPSDEEHIGKLADALSGEEVTHIIVTHTHLDHSPGAKLLKQAVGGVIVGALSRPLPEGASTVESIEFDFAPDRELADGASIEGDGWTLNAVYTPGHMSNHHCLALAEENALFSGDHVMGWNTTIVSPPDGNMAEYLTSLERCIARDDAVYYPGHGPEIAAPKPFVRAYLGHRRMRETQIMHCLANGPMTIAELVKKMYAHLPERMHGAAARSVHAHMEHMVEDGRVTCDGAPSSGSVYAAA